MKVMITGLAGMIGFHLACKLENEGHEVCGIDNFNDYYEVSLKHERARLLKSFHDIDVTIGDITTFNYDTYFALNGKPDVIMHLAAYANPRHSMEFPYLYIDTNIVGTQRLMEAAERNGIDNVVYASSSCVMHGQPLPWNETDLPTHQNNPYGWSKRVNECQFFSSTIPKTIGLRFFTVAGPWGRPDMFMHIATKAIFEGKTIRAFNNGNMWRDFTFVEDIVQGVMIVLNKIVEDTSEYNEIYNIGYGQKNNLMDFIHCVEKHAGKKAIIELVPAHPADVPATWADTSKLQALGYKPGVPMDDGVKECVEWYKSYYHV